jgi:uncharacterized circularly permuted ATP-grasp superfamily protein/uncharacterized alpha-E superfamily protein
MSSHPEAKEHWPNYTVSPSTYDEMCTTEGTVREHWRYLIDAFHTLGPGILEQRRQDTVRLLRDDGATYNVYGDPEGLNRPWGLDPIPMLVSSEEWATIESSLIQRAELLSLILNDIYGPRKLLKKGLLPPEVIYAHRGFFRACNTSCLPTQNPLVLYAADLARAADGQIWVISDRTQAPSGTGYALENRTVMSRIFPSLFRDSHPHRLASFFRKLRTTLTALAPQAKEYPRIVILTPGPLNETYFEHVYLAHYLGYTLVEGSDLTVREGRVWLRSLEGLEPVDVLLRRVDDDYCDPLELRPDSRLGVPGLLEMVRRGKISVVNPLGCSVLENPALMAFLPTIAKYYFGHELTLPSVATWWCGQDKEMDYVLANLDRLVVRTIDRAGGALPILGNQLTQSELDELRSKIHAQPYRFVGQEQMNPSTVPLSVNGALEPRRAVVRAFLTASEDSFIVMPGGLTRVTSDPNGVLVSNQTGAISKDTWVLASEPENKGSLWPEVKARLLRAELREPLSSRTAENLYWMGRYAERAEQAIRLVRNVYTRTNEFIQTDDNTTKSCLTILLRGLTHLTMTYPGFAGVDSDRRMAQPKDEILDVILNGHRVGTIVSNLKALLNSAYSVRDIVSTDTWRILGDIEGELNRLENQTSSELAELQYPLGRLITALMALTGLTTESMPRELGWRFLDSGRRIERALLAISLERSTLVIETQKEMEVLLLESVLATAESLELYRRRYRNQVRFENVLDLLLHDENNPRSIAYQIKQLREHVAALPRQSKRPLSEEAKLVLEASTLIELSDTHEFAWITPNSGLRERLDQALSRLSHLISHASAAITQTYFVHINGPHQLSDPSSYEVPGNP